MSCLSMTQYQFLSLLFFFLPFLFFNSAVAAITKIVMQFQFSATPTYNKAYFAHDHKSTCSCTLHTANQILMTSDMTDTLMISCTSDLQSNTDRLQSLYIR